MAEQTEYIVRKVVSLQDPDYFCNRSWTLSFNLNTKSWISFHSYIPNFYMAENNFFYSGLNSCCDFDFEFIAGNIIPYTTTSTSTAYPCDLEVVLIPEYPIPEPIPTTTTTTAIPTTTTTTTPIPYYMCIGAGLQFDTYSTGLLSALTIGSVISTEGMVVGDYLIEWRLNAIDGIIVLYSGVGADPLIQAVHPFENEPVQGGTLYPVINYIYLDGIKYSPYIGIGELYSPDLIGCLPEPGVEIVQVEELNCTNGTQPQEDSYTHLISYENAIDPAVNAERIVTFRLNDDGSTAYFAWQFNGMNVADRITIQYISILDPNNPILLDDWAVGSNLAETNFDTIPKQWSGNYFRSVCDLTTIPFTVGDYLYIHIVPRIAEPENSNTNWYLFMRCLDTLTFDVIPDGWNMVDTNTIALTYNEANCSYDLSFDTIASYWYNYLNDFQYIMMFNQSWYVYDQHQVVSMTNHTTVYGRYDQNFQQICIAQDGSTTIIKTGSIITFSFSNSSDYNIYKTSYNDILALLQYSWYNPDNTNYRHYMGFAVYIIDATSCGDNEILHYYFMHYDSIFTWDDDLLILTIDMATTTNGITQLPCNNSYSYANGEINLYNQSIAMADISFSTNARNIKPFYFRYNYSSTNAYWNYDDNAYIYVPGITFDALSGLFGSGWCYYEEQYQNPDTYLIRALPYYMNVKLAVYVEITDHNDPLNNFTVYTHLRDSGCIYYSNDKQNEYTKIYEMIGGSVIPIPTTTTTTTATPSTTTTTTTIINTVDSITGPPSIPAEPDYIYIPDIMYTGPVKSKYLWSLVDYTTLDEYNNPVDIVAISSITTIQTVFVHPIYGGTFKLHLDILDNSDNVIESYERSIVITKLDQVITFNPIPDKLTTDDPFDITEYLSSSVLDGLYPTTSTTDTDIITIFSAYAYNLVTIVGEGVATITAVEPGNLRYNAAIPVDQTLTVIAATTTTTTTTP